MTQKRILFACMVFAVSLGKCKLVTEVFGAGGEQKESKDGKRLFLDVSIALSEERFEEAHAMAERLIGDYGRDYQIREYLGLYEDTFFLSHEEHRKGGIPPVDSPPPQWLKSEVEAMMAKSGKSVLDLVKLVAVGDKRICGSDFPAEYLEEILRRFPESPWADWAEWLLIENRVYRPREKYEDKRPEERFRLLARDMYEAGKEFVEEHPDSHVLPGILHMMAGKRIVMSEDQQSKDEASSMSRAILEGYPSAESLCASARLRLRRLLGDGYEEEEGYSEGHDRIIARFYSRSFGVDDYKREVAEYLSIKKESEEGRENESGSADLGSDRRLPAAAYILIAVGGAAGLTGLVLLLNRWSRRKHG